MFLDCGGEGCLRGWGISFFRASRVDGREGYHVVLDGRKEREVQFSQVKSEKMKG